MDRRDKNRESVRRWYHRHRDEYAELRKQRYASDPALRKKARASAAKYRAARREGLKVKRELTRVLNGMYVTVHTSGYVADELKCSPQVLRNWEARGWIPASVFADKHRLYTQHQIDLLKLLVATLRSNKHGLRSVQHAEAEIKPVVDLIHKTWSATYAEAGNTEKPERRRQC